MGWMDHFVAVKPADVDIEKRLANPGDFILVPQNDSRIRMYYRKDLDIQGLQVTDDFYGFKNHSHITFIEFDRADWDGDDDSLCHYLASGLKRSVSLDFDLTLTKQHTDPDVRRGLELSPANNYRFASQMDVIRCLSSKPDCHLSIVTNQTREIVEEHLEAWFPEGWQRYIASLRANESEKLGNRGKDAFIRAEHDAVLSKRRFKPGTLSVIDLNAEPFIIDIVECTMVDDDVETIQACQAGGIRCFQVNLRTNNHLVYLNQTFNLGLDLRFELLPQKENRRPNPLTEGLQRQNSKRALFADVDVVEVTQPAQGELESPAKRLAADLEDLRIISPISAK